MLVRKGMILYTYQEHIMIGAECTWSIVSFCYTVLLLITGDLLSACPHRQFYTLPGLLDSRVALPNSYPNALHAYAGRQFVPFYDGLWDDLIGSYTQPTE